ncbi:MAG: TonB-dependent receptor, partial [Kordiimonadaceae bacterium]|nr:TonB-dependent receptor [Kordiimonadaceae bacterium]
RIEVLRGPQSTLFGKNTTAGVINYITKAPHYDLEVEAELTYGNLDAKIAKVGVNIPIVDDRFAIRLDANVNKRDGFVENIDGRILNERNRYGLRGQMLFEPSDTVSFRLIVDYNDIDEECCAAPFFDIAPTTLFVLGSLGSQIAGVEIKDQVTFVSGDVISQLTTKGISGHWDVEFDSFDLTSITAYRKYDEFQDFDADFTDLPLNKSREETKGYGTFTQEVRLTSTGDNAVDWMVGAYYLDQTLDITSTTLQGPLLRAFGDGLSGNAISGIEAFLGLPFGTFLAEDSGLIAGTFDQTNQTYAAFVQTDWHVNDKLTITTGLRYTKDKKSLESDIVIDDPFAGLNLALFGASALAPFQFFPPAPNVSDTSSSSEVSGTVIINYTMSDEMNVYGSYSRGFKGGGFALDAAAARVGSFSFDPEFVDAYELGLKARLLDNRLSLDFALYQNDIVGFQANTFTGSSFVPSNAGDINIRGLEFDGKFQVTPNLLLTGGFNWLFKAEFGDYPNALCPVVRQDLCTEVQVAGSNSIILVRNLDGQRIGEAAKFTGNIAATYTTAISSDLEMIVRGAVYYNGHQFLSTDLDERQVQDGYALVSASIGVGDQDGTWNMRLWARNLLDKFYVVDTFNSTIPGGSLNAYYGAPRTFGVTLSTRF